MSAALIVAVTGLILILAAAIVGAVLYVRRRRGFLARSQSALAVVIGVRSIVFSLSRGPTYVARVSFYAATGQPVTTEIRLYTIGFEPRIARGTPPVRPGWRLWVAYDPVNPARAELDTRALPAAGRLPGSPNAISSIGVFAGVFMGVIVLAVTAIVAITNLH